MYHSQLLSKQQKATEGPKSDSRDEVGPRGEVNPRDEVGTQGWLSSVGPSCSYEE
jgi:hypothetical protein